MSPSEKGSNRFFSRWRGSAAVVSVAAANDSSSTPEASASDTSPGFFFFPCFFDFFEKSL